MRQNLYYNGQDFYVEGHHIAKVRNWPDYPDEPEDFEIDTVILIDCLEDGTENNIDVTDTYKNDFDFLMACLEQRPDLIF